MGYVILYVATTKYINIPCGIMLVQVFDNTAFYDGVSNTHNIVSNPESNTVFLVGSTRAPASGGTICSGG